MTDTIINPIFNYEDLPDEDVIGKVQQGDNNALNYIINKYYDLVNMKTNKFFIVGAEKSDIIQVGLIGLYKATKSFNNQKQTSFKTFANKCIERQIITAVKTANRQKNIPLNSAFSINTQLYDDNEDNNTELVDILNTNYVEDPSDSITRKEYFDYINKSIAENLSQHEKDVLKYFRQNKSYQEIAEKLNCKTKSVDTAMTRIRRKANKIKQEVKKRDEG